MYQKISDMEKFYASETVGVSRFSVENFLSHSTEKFCWGTLRCIKKFRVSQNFMHKKRISLNSVENFLSHSAEKFRKGILLFLRKFLVSADVLLCLSETKSLLKTTIAAAAILSKTFDFL